MESSKIIALTFDDGPNTTTTIATLDVLKKYDVRASFFLIGNNITEETIPVIKQEIALGHEIQNHSLTHSAMDAFDAQTIRDEIRETSEKITALTGIEPRFFRPPYIITSDLMYEAIDMPFICGVGVEDWVPEVSAAERARRVLEDAVDGTIVLLHDFPGNESTVEALEVIIPELKKRGFTFVTITELFEAKKEPIAKNPGKLYSVIP